MGKAEQEAFRAELAKMHTVQEGTRAYEEQNERAWKAEGRLSSDDWEEMREEALKG